MRIVHQGLILVLVPLILAVAVIGVTFNCILQTDANRLAESRERRVADNACQSMLVLGDVGICVQDFVLHANKAQKQRLKDDLAQYRVLRDEGARMDNGGSQQAYLAGLDELMQDAVGQLQVVISAFKRGDISTVMATIDRQRREYNQRLYKLSRSISAINVKATAHLQASQATQKQYFQLETWTLFGGVAASIAIGLLLARWFMTGIAQRLQVIMDNTIRLSRGQDLNPGLAGRDEIATLDRGFHSMASALRAAMAKERALFESASDVICIFDTQYRLTAVNPAFTAILGYEPEMAVGRCFLEFVSGDDVERTTELLSGTEFGAPSVVFENSVIHYAGRRLELLWSIYRSKLDEALYAVAHDISDRRHVERAKEEFLSMVSHDLRSPLSSIYGTFKLLSASAFGTLPDTVQQKVSGILVNVNRLLALVNDLLDVEKLQSGKMDLAVAAANLPELMQRVIAEVEPLASGKQIKIDVDCRCPEFPLDADRINQVLVNLLSNAVKYSPSGTTVTLKASSDDRQLKIQVCDSGRGVPDDQKARIFERFKQARSSDANVGTGLGLPICKMIVEQHGGAIGVESGNGDGASTGSTFWFTLPKAPGGQGTAGAASPPSPAAAVVTPVAAPKLKKPGSARDKRQSRWFSFTNLRLMQKGAILLIVPVLFEVMLAGSLYPLLRTAFEEQQQEMTYLLYGRLCTNLITSFSALATVISLPQWTEKWPAFLETSSEIAATEKQIRQELANDPEAWRFMWAVDQQMLPVDTFIHRALDTVNKYGVNQHTVDIEAFSNRDQLVQVFVDTLPAAKKAMTMFNDRGRASPEKLRRLRDQQGAVLLAGLLASLLISAASALIFSSGIARRLRVTEDNVHRLEQDQPLNPPLPGNDELSHLDQYFHSMANALNEARRKERAVFDNSQDIMSAWNQQGMVLRMSPASRQMLGFEPAELLGRSILDLVALENKLEAIRLLKTAAEGMPACEFESTVLRKDGTPCEILWSLSWSPQEEAVVAIGHDISERKRLERLKKEFLSMVSHDMRTPLASIALSAEMMTEGAAGELPEKARKQLTVVSRSCDRLLLLINDLLDIEKLESGNMQLNIEEVSAFGVLQRSAEALANLSESKSINVLIDASETLTVAADGGRLVQVAVNLLSNAIKFSEAGSTIRLSAAKRQRAVEFAISDSGRGIPESHLDSVFERYRQVDAADGRPRQGTGLGLPIAKQIVEQHGGEIGVSSKPGQGSTFWFRIPITSPSEAPHEPAEMPPGTAR